MASASHPDSRTATATAAPFSPDPPTDPEVLSRWLAEGIDQGAGPEQTLALIGLGLMRRLAASGQDLPWYWVEEEGSHPDLSRLRQRLELTQLAIRTGAPLTTAEVTQLLGARPTTSVVERGGLMARRLGRNVWKLSRSGDDQVDGQSGRQDVPVASAFQESLRRRL